MVRVTTSEGTIEALPSCGHFTGSAEAPKLFATAHERPITEWFEGTKQLSKELKAVGLDGKEWYISLGPLRMTFSTCWYGGQDEEEGVCQVLDVSDLALDGALTSGGWVRNESERELVLDFRTKSLARKMHDGQLSWLPLGTSATSTRGMEGMKPSLRCAWGQRRGIDAELLDFDEKVGPPKNGLPGSGRVGNERAGHTKRCSNTGESLRGGGDRSETHLGLQATSKAPKNMRWSRPQSGARCRWNRRWTASATRSLTHIEYALNVSRCSGAS